MAFLRKVYPMSTVSSFFDYDPLLAPLLRRLSYYARISASDSSQLSQIVLNQEQHSRGDTLLENGHHTNKVYVISEGWTAQEIITEEGSICIVGFLLPGDTSSINSALDIASDVSIKCLTEVSVVTMRADALKALLAGNANLTQAFSLMRLAGERMNREMFVNLAAKPAAQKTAHLLCELSLRDRQVRSVKGISPTVRLTQLEIGEALGLSSVHVNRTIKRMRQEGLLDVRSGAIHIKDWDELARLYRFDSTYMTQYEIDARQAASSSLA